MQSARLVNAYHRVNPNAQRNPQKKDPKPKEEKADKLELSEEETKLEVVAQAPEGPDEDGHLDIAV